MQPSDFGLGKEKSEEGIQKGKEIGQAN